ncbi:hypothetical protein GALMADRAFT_65908 [Galerina marginata CBS 339.88]|uniref:Integrase core domain-containing protein n=1 Tax=Galerina marginata (strain CBS 339.88) TaxID=685588 RepID=A0A067T5E5_GALM3|nr:hypothetical protein GALMADRAFT_65908 [Galerina marginata CBS 339.88]
MRKSDVEILHLLRTEHIDTDLYGIGMTSYKATRKRMGLLSTRQQNHTVKTIRDSMVALRKRFPKAGAREMSFLLFHEMGMSVSRHIIVVYFRVYEHDLVRERKAGRLKRRRFWAAGVNDMVAVDQHDKWKRFGLALHTGVDPFPGRIHWLKVWWTNSNPKLILSYYLEVIEKFKHMPLVTQSDPGSENYGLANGHTALRHWHDPNLAGTIQHHWMRQKKNVKPEITWSQLRRRFTPGFEDLLETGVTNGWYDTNRPIDILVFQWIFIPFLQSELDAWADRVNNTRKRADRNKILPHGVPNDIYNNPERFGALNFKIQVEQAAIDHVRQAFAPPSDPVFELVPSEFGKYAGILYTSMGSPTVNSENVWDIYRELVHRFEHLDDAADFNEECQVYLDTLEDQSDIEIAVPPLGVELYGGIENPDTNGDYYMGGVNNGQGLDTAMEKELDRMDDKDEDFEVAEVQFSDEESDDTEGDEW